MPARRWIAVLAPLAALAILAGATLREPLAKWLSPQRPPDRVTIVLSKDYIGSGLIQIAAAKGYFAAEGIDAVLLPQTSGHRGLDVVMAGMADLVTVGETPVMFATMRGAPVAILATIATVAQSHGIVARRDRGIASPGDLSGKTIGLPLGGSAHFLLTGILAAHRIPVGSVQLRNMAPEELAPALAAGSVDAVAGWDPWLYRARQAAGSEAVTLYGDRGFAFWFHLVGQREAMEDNPERMRKVLRALTRAERLLESEPEVARAIVANATAMEPALFLESWPRYALRLKLHQGLLPMLEDQARWAMANGYVKPAPMPNFLDAIHMDALHAVRPDAVSIVH